MEFPFRVISLTPFVVLANVSLLESFLLLSAALWFLSPLARYSDGHNMSQGVVPFLVYLAGIIIWGFPLLFMEQVGAELIMLYYIRICRSILKTLDEKMYTQSLTSKDREKLRAIWWKMIGPHVYLSQKRKDLASDNQV